MGTDRATLLTGIVDLSGHERPCLSRLEAAQRQGLCAVITKCTQGKDFLDESHASFRDECVRLGLLFGDYHFGSGTSDGRQQADWYLSNAAPGALHALDYEWQQIGRNGKPKFPEMALRQAEDFVVRVREVTGRWPLVYTSRAYLTRDRLPAPDSVLSRCPLWVCSRVSPPKLPLSPWTDWALWQYTNGHTGPRDAIRFPRMTPSLGLVDRNAFRGSAAELASFWRECGA